MQPLTLSQPLVHTHHVSKLGCPVGLLDTRIPIPRLYANALHILQVRKWLRSRSRYAQEAKNIMDHILKQQKQAEEETKTL